MGCLYVLIMSQMSFWPACVCLPWINPSQGGIEWDSRDALVFIHSRVYIATVERWRITWLLCYYEWLAPLIPDIMCVGGHLFETTTTTSSSRQTDWRPVVGVIIIDGGRVGAQMSPTSLSGMCHCGRSLLLSPQHHVYLRLKFILFEVQQLYSL